MALNYRTPYRSAPPSRIPLALAALAILAGLAYWLLTPPPPPAVAKDAKESTLVSPATLPPELEKSTSTRPPNQAQRPPFEPVLSLKVPAEGKIVLVRCQLRARLDPHTERTWRSAGLLEAEKSVTDPLLRIVRVAAQDDLDLLVDWHVKGAAVLSEQALNATRVR